MVKSYKDLLVWQKAVDLAETVYAATNQFPKNQQYSLAQQMERSAVSISSNIAEGAGRHSTKEFKQFISIAIGSLAELETQIIIAERQKFVDAQKAKDMMLRIDEIGKMLYGLRNKLQERINNGIVASASTGASKEKQSTRHSHSPLVLQEG